MLRQKSPFVLALAAGVIFSIPLRSQVPAGAGSPVAAPLGALRTIEKQDWHVFGRVTTLQGDPVPRAKVRMDIGVGNNRLQTVETNLQGEFSAVYSLEATTNTSLVVKLSVDKPGFAPARELVDFGSQGKTWEIDIILPNRESLSGELLLNELTAVLGARLRSAGPAAGSLKKDFDEGSRNLLDRHDAARALLHLAKVAKREPECLGCRLMYGLALLAGGSWASGEKEFAAAAHQNETAAPAERKVEPLIVLGVLESWRREPKKAAGAFLEALKVSPHDPLALQEIGRSQVELRNWEPAEQYLTDAVKAGAGPEARLLLVETLLAEGALEQAGEQMTAYVNARDIRALPPHARALYSDLHNRMELKSHGTVKSYVTQPVEQLVRAVPELGGLAPEADQSQLPAVLAGVGGQVAAFFKDFPNTVSLEQVRQERVHGGGKTTQSGWQKFDYLLLATADQVGLGLEEYRTDGLGNRANPQGLSDGFMLTAGFASASLYFHPSYQSGAQFRLLGRQNLQGRDTWVVAFAQRPETAQLLERFNTGEASALILLQGVAWADTTSFEIVRLRTDLLNPPPELRLDRQTTEITYGRVSFKDSSTPFWLPREVTVTVEWKGKTFRNLHEYSDFRLFNVEAREKRKSS